MGAGSSQEAEYSLHADLPAGTWHLAGDGSITQPVDVRFEIFVRRADTMEVPIVAWDHHFEPLGNGNFQAQTYDATGDGPAVTFEAGDQLILRYTGTSSASMSAYQPNGDGPIGGGRIPFIDLP
ncbi:MAG TPA: hypothetical protein VHE35_37120 [Kofleriaceae bacterium]|nr:hypothetical protein [Kofleriaceae bacterium]